MITISREEALRRWNEAVRVKKEMTESMLKELTEDYERKHGEKPKYVEVW